MDTSYNEYNELEAFAEFAYGTQVKVQSVLRQLGWVPSNGLWTHYGRGITCTWKHAIEIAIESERNRVRDH